MNMHAEKPPRVSMIETTEMVLPNDTNFLGNLLGGRMMHWMDIAGAMAASRHANTVVATVAVDSLDFRHPVRKGEIVILKAKLIFTGRTSMEVAVTASAENITSGAIIVTNKAFFTYVALDDSGNPTPVPRLTPETDEERDAFQAAAKRREERIKR